VQTDARPPQPVDILLVEDNPGDVRLIQETLQDGKLLNRVVTVTDGQKALAYLRKQGSCAQATRPDLILLDLNIPRKDGHEVLAEIKADPRLRSIPVVIVTSSQAEEDILRSYNTHANCYVTKPADLEKFVTVVRAIGEFWVTIVKLPPEAVRDHERGDSGLAVGRQSGRMEDQRQDQNPWCTKVKATPEYERTSADKMHVLLIEDNPGDVRLVEEMLKESGEDDFALRHVGSLQSGISLLSQDCGSQVILLDLELPDVSGLETLRRIAPFAEEASVVVITGSQDERLGIEALKVGAVDYLIKDQIDGRQLRRILHYAVERHHMQTELHSLALHDELTGLHNRRGFLLLAEQQMKISRRNHSSCQLLFLDIDGLKRINDTLGHAAGNGAIVEAAGVLRSAFRQCDILARIGGDEFAALAVGTWESSGAALRAHLEQKFNQVNAQPNRTYPLSFSVGIVPCGASVRSSIEDLLAKSDALMYQDKQHKTLNARPSSAGA